MGRELLPYFTQIVTRLNEWFTANKELINQDIKTFVSGIGKAVEFTGKVMHVLVSQTREFSLALDKVSLKLTQFAGVF